MSEGTETMGLSDDSKKSEKVEALEASAQFTPQDIDGMPYCELHHCRHVQYKGKGPKNPRAYTKCPVPDCKHREIRIKTKVLTIVPPHPCKCQRCNIFMEKDDAKSDATYVVLTCPECLRSLSPKPLPQFAATYFNQRSG